MQPSIECTTIDIAGSPVVLVESELELANAVDRLSLGRGAVLVLVGGAGSMHPDSGNGHLRDLFFEVLAPLAESLQAIVIDGGTDSGVMKWMGAARSSIRGSFPLIGVAAIDTIDLPERSGKGSDTAPLAPGHSHYLIVPGQHWGDESPWIARVASLLSHGSKSITIVVNGGEITLRDISFSIRESRPILVFSGTGRTADRLAAGLEAENPDPQIHALISSGLIRALAIDRDPAELKTMLRSWLAD